MKHLRSGAHRHLCAVLIAVRKEAGLTQRQLAERLKKPRSFVANIETGERAIKALEVADWAKATNLVPWKLYKRAIPS